ncbi:hypothetical protein EMCRGX_G003832 [Ephydatia muelleri]
MQTLSADQGTCFTDENESCSRDQSNGGIISSHKWDRYVHLINSSLATYRECEAEGCGCYEDILGNDLSPWREAGITLDDFKAAREYAPRVVLYQVIDHTLYRQSNCVFEFRCKGIEHFLLQVVEDLPDVEFLVNTLDYPMVHRLAVPRPLPIFSFSKTGSYVDIMYPAWTFWAGGPAISLEPIGLGRWDLKRDTVTRKALESPWNKKTPVAFFRGSRTSADRDPLVLFSRSHPHIVDAAYTKNQAWRSDQVRGTSPFLTSHTLFFQDTLGEPAAQEVSLEDHCKYRYLFNFRGVAASFRFKHLFLCKSLVLHVGSEWVEFFYPLLKPWVHYIPVDPDMKEIGWVELMEFVRSNDKIVEAIAARGHNHIWKHLKMDDITCYWRQLLTRYAGLLRWRVIDMATKPHKESAAVKKVKAIQAKKRRPKNYKAAKPGTTRDKRAGIAPPGDDERVSEDEESDYTSSDEEEQEDPRDYCKGGYHPVQIGDIYNKRYKVLRKLGWGHFSTVWLCWDDQEKRYIALKVVKSELKYAEAAMDEIELLLKVASCKGDGGVGWNHVVQMYENFKLYGPNGTHICMVFEVLGYNLFKLIVQTKYQGLDIPLVKSITRQVLMGLNYLHRECSIIHTDIKPENILMCVSEKHVMAMATEGAKTKSAVSAISATPTTVQQRPVVNPSSLGIQQPTGLGTQQPTGLGPAAHGRAPSSPLVWAPSSPLVWAPSSR